MEDLTAPAEPHFVGNLQSYLSAKLRVSNEDPFTVRQYSAAQLNPTFFIQSPSSSYVLRKRYPGEMQPGTHQMDREYLVQKALFSSGFPVPKPVLFCSDVEVIGTEFYLMDHVKGRIFRDLQLPGMSPAERTAVFVAAVEVLAKLHSLNLASLKLEGFGKGPGYCKRQVSIWTKRYTAAAHRDIPAMNELSDWLKNNLPEEADEVTLVHGDYRLDNFIFHPTEARVTAVLDWEMSTTGNPLVDLAYFLIPLYLPTSLNISNTVCSLQGIEGVPAAGDLISVYCRCRGIPSESLPQLNFYLALSAFKIAAFQMALAHSWHGTIDHIFQSVELLAKVALQLVKSPLTSPTSDGLFPPTARGRAVLQQVKDFLQQYVAPVEEEVIEYYKTHAHSPQRWQFPQIIVDLREKAKQAGLWNMSLPAISGLSLLDYAYIAEETGRYSFGDIIFNHHPDAEIIELLGSEEKKKWLEPLLSGEISSCFCMSEPDISNSDIANMQCSLRRDNDGYVINGKKWWSSGAGNPVCKVTVVMCRSSSKDAGDRHGQYSMILVPMDTPGVKLIRPLTVFGQEDAIIGGHFEVHFENVHVPATNIILGEGRGLDIARERLGTSKVHLCMGMVGIAERALEMLVQRAASRQTFGKKLYQHQVIAHWIAECRLMIDQTRLLTLKAAHSLDTLGIRAAHKQVAMIKVAAARMSSKVVDIAIQVHGAAGVSQDLPLAQMYLYTRCLRIADGTDEVHLASVAKLELKEQLKKTQAKL